MPPPQAPIFYIVGLCPTDSLHHNRSKQCWCFLWSTTSISKHLAQLNLCFLINSTGITVLIVIQEDLFTTSNSWKRESSWRERGDQAILISWRHVMPISSRIKVVIMMTSSRSLMMIMVITLIPLIGPLYDFAEHKANESNAGQPKVVFIFTILDCVLTLELSITRFCCPSTLRRLTCFEWASGLGTKLLNNCQPAAKDGHLPAVNPS